MASCCEQVEVNNIPVGLSANPPRFEGDKRRLPPGKRRCKSEADSTVAKLRRDALRPEA